MDYLYGDLTPAPFTTNFLEELRDAIDFAAALADADQCVVTAEARRELLRRQADEETLRIDALVHAMGGAIERADKGDPDSPTTVLADELSRDIGQRRSNALLAVENKLNDGLRTLEKETLEARADYFPILERYLLARLPPSGKQTLYVELVGAKKGERRYVAELLGRSDVGLEWRFELAVPSAGEKEKEDEEGTTLTFADAVRVNDIVESLTISAPHLTGLIKKEVKSKKTKLKQHIITKLVDDAGSIRVEMREEIGKTDGFDITADLERKVIMVTKTGEEDDETVGTFDVAAEDRPPLFELTAKLRASARALRKKRLVAATFEALSFNGEDASAQPKLVQLVSRLCDKLVSAVEEVARRSRADDELVLRRLLDDGRREEVFMPKQRLREKLGGLDLLHRDMFVAIEHALETTEITETTNIDVDELRKERSAPPPPPPLEEWRSEVPTAQHKYPRRDSNKQMEAVRAEIPKAKEAQAPPPPPPPPQARSEPDAKPALEIELDSLVDKKPVLEIQPDSIPDESRPPRQPDVRPQIRATPSAGIASGARILTPPNVALNVAIDTLSSSSSPPSSRDAELKAMLKAAHALSKEGKHDDAFRAYASLFTSEAFQASKPEDQRQVLRMMIHAKGVPSSVMSTDDSKAAHKAALSSLQALVVGHRDPADYEMLGMAYAILEEPTKATEIFKKALEIERARSPGSDLCGDLMRRVSQL